MINKPPKLPMGRAKKITLVIVIGIVGFFAIGLSAAFTYQMLYPEEYAKQAAEREEKQKFEQQLEQQKQEAIQKQESYEKKLQDYQDAVDKNGILKYRPYWAVSDTYREAEMNGRISTSDVCLGMVQIINYDPDPDVRMKWEDIWKQNCFNSSSTASQLSSMDITKAKSVLDNYLQSLDNAVSQCNSLPASAMIPSSGKDAMEQVIVNSAEMVLLVEKTPTNSGLLPYKQKIITKTDELTNCVNRH
ncbi:hypothetical protein [Candidatus Nitrosotenuis uzonensis]|uniref:Uncharacterized protein n=1 Tax=Candidatus Nitrosotenuis uzonensis TaxID=1407055 RepID=V6AQN7_9ARCH|nr:hypothetical protein [Candidatus Nitrosotenuis uzonensis]CDI04947.1 exported hypothetical protein [Candidatus Nitrosotenuis uzonensis]